MEMRKISAGRLRGIGYDRALKLLQVQLDDGSVLQYSAVGEEVWRRLMSSASAWSFYRDNIEEEYTSKKVAANASSPGSHPAGRNPLDELFKSD